MSLSKCVKAFYFKLICVVYLLRHSKTPFSLLKEHFYARTVDNDLHLIHSNFKTNSNSNFVQLMQSKPLGGAGKIWGFDRKNVPLGRGFDRKFRHLVGNLFFTPSNFFMLFDQYT